MQFALRRMIVTSCIGRRTVMFIWSRVRKRINLNWKSSIILGDGYSDILPSSRNNPFVFGIRHTFIQSIKSFYHLIHWNNLGEIHKQWIASTYWVVRLILWYDEVKVLIMRLDEPYWKLFRAIIIWFVSLFPIISFSPSSSQPIDPQNSPSDTRPPSDAERAKANLGEMWVDRAWKGRHANAAWISHHISNLNRIWAKSLNFWFTSSDYEFRSLFSALPISTCFRNACHRIQQSVPSKQ